MLRCVEIVALELRILGMDRFGFWGLGVRMLGTLLGFASGWLWGLGLKSFRVLWVKSFNEVAMIE